MERAAPLHARARAHLFKPPRHVRFVLQRLLLTLPQRRPAPDGNIRDRKEIACDEFMRGQPPIQNPIEPRDLGAIAVLGIGQVVGGIHRRSVFQEMMCLARHRAEAAHLPHQPFFDRDAIAFGGAIKLPGLAGQVHQDRTAFEYRDRRPVRPIGIDDGGHAVVGRNFQELRGKLVARTDVHEMRGIGQAHFLKCN